MCEHTTVKEKKRSWRFWRKHEAADDKRETVLSIEAREGAIQALYVKAQSPKEAEDLMKKLREITRGAPHRRPKEEYE